MNTFHVGTRKRKAIVPLLLVIFVNVFQVSCSGDRDETVELSVGNHVFTVEIADDPDERTRGLMDRNELAENHGMLFVFPRAERRSFWMKDTKIPLSIAYINQYGEILEIYHMEPLSLEPVSSRYPAQYALEVPRSNFERLGITTGVVIDLDGLPSWVVPR